MGGPYSVSPWRQEHGELLDIGPHAIDIVDAALGPITGVQAHRNRHGWLGLLFEHEGGATSDVSLCEHAPIESITDVEVIGTGFTIDAEPDHVDVSVSHGHVRVTGADGAHDLHDGEHLDVRARADVL